MFTVSGVLDGLNIGIRQCVILDSEVVIAKMRLGCFLSASVVSSSKAIAWHVFDLMFSCFRGFQYLNYLQRIFSLQG